MRHLILAGGVLSALAFAGCGGSAPAQPPAVPAQAATPFFGLPHADTAGMTAGVTGLAEIHLDPDTLTAEVLPLRELTTQGDLYELSIRPFFRPRDIRVRSIERGPAAGTVLLTVEFHHPFPMPADLNPPATASKRIDLHIFDVSALLAVEGADAFYGGSVVTNASLLRNADGYRDPGATFDRSALGVTNATIFPYKLVAQNIDTGNPLGNYSPFGNGWTEFGLLSPEGYDIFPQGGSATVTFDLDVSGGSTSFPLVVLAKYMDPRATPDPKSKRLPVPGDPTSLRYILPEAAGDIQRIEASVSGSLVGGSSSEIVIVDLAILDWDHDAEVAAPFPNNGNLGQVARASHVSQTDASVPALDSNPYPIAPPAGPGPVVTTAGGIINTNLYDPAAPESLLGLVRVTDAQHGASPVTIALDESLAPVAALDSIRYQVIRIPIVPSPSVDPVTVTLLPEPSGGVNAEMGNGNISFGFLSDYSPRIMISEGNGDMYVVVLQNTAPLDWRIYRSTDGGATWGPGSAIPHINGGAITPTTDGMSIGIMANGLPALAISGSTQQLGFISAVNESGFSTTWNAGTRGTVINNVGRWRDPLVLPHPTNPNRSYVISENYFITGTPDGPNHSQLNMWLTTNALADNPTFSLLGVVDSLDTGLVRDQGLRGVFDSLNRMHLVWNNLNTLSATIDQTFYRRFDDDGSPSGGTWAAAEVEIGQGTAVADLSIVVNAANDPIVVWKDTDPDPIHTGDNQVLLTKYTTGTGWSTPYRINDPPDAGLFANQILFPNLALDSAGRIHAIWRDSRASVGSPVKYAVWGTVLSGDGQTKLVPGDFEVFPVHADTQRYITYGPALEWDPVSQRMTAIARANGPMAVPSGLVRYRQYTVSP